MIASDQVYNHQLENDNGGMSECRIEQSFLCLARREYPSASTFLRAVESCQGCFDLWAGNDRNGLQSLLNQWIQAGRPEINWS